MTFRLDLTLTAIALIVFTVLPVHAQGLPPKAPPHAVSPPAASGSAPAKPAPLTPETEPGGSKILYVGPTANITAVANHIHIQAKSLNSLVTVDPGLVLSRPITISIAYLSPWPVGNDRRTEPYRRSLGNRFLYGDPEGDEKPRKIHMDITLTEPKPGGGAYSSNVPADLTLDPLYDVEITPLMFMLVTGCSNVGANQIDLHWYAPDEDPHGSGHKVHFATKEQERFVINEFQWARSELSATAHLHQEFVWYTQEGSPIDLGGFPFGGFAPIAGPAGQDLVPGKTHRSPPGLVHASGVGSKDCQATLDYTVTYQLRAYFGGGPPVR